MTLGEDVGEGGLRSSSGPELLRHDLHPLGRAPLELRRDVVAAETGRDEIDGVVTIGARDDVEPLELVRHGEAVSRLGLDGGRAEREKTVEPRQERCDQRGLVGAADAAEARANATARGGDLHVGAPRDALLELALPRPEEHGVRVRVHESRDHESTRGVQDLGRSEASAEFLLRAHGDDPIAVAGHGLALRVVHTRPGRRRRGDRCPAGSRARRSRRRGGCRARGRRILANWASWSPPSLTVPPFQAQRATAGVSVSASAVQSVRESSARRRWRARNTIIFVFERPTPSRRPTSA